MSMRMIEGEVDTHDERDDEIADLKRELRELRSARAVDERAVAELRRQLAPLYRALQGVFGEIDTVDEGRPDGPVAPVTNSRTAAIWASWKSRMGNAGCVIDALLLHSEMNTTQLAIATGRSRRTIPALIFKLKKAGLLVKNGDRFSLKSLT